MTPENRTLAALICVMATPFVTVLFLAAHEIGSSSGRDSLARELVESGTCEWSVDSQSGERTLRGVCP